LGCKSKKNTKPYPIRRTNCNGENVEIEAIARRIATHCNLLNNRYYPIIIVDREDRQEPASVLAIELERAIRQEGITDTLIIGVADRMVENWILADKDVIGNHPDCTNVPPNDIEGIDGKHEMHKCIKYYHETTHGVELLLKAKASVISGKSPSFLSLVNSLPPNDCWWLSR
jgi:hypothetical protein